MGRNPQNWKFSNKLSCESNYPEFARSLCLMGVGLREGGTGGTGGPLLRYSVEELYSSILGNTECLSCMAGIGISISAWNSENSLPSSSVILSVWLTQILGIGLPKTNPFSQISCKDCTAAAGSPWKLLQLGSVLRSQVSFSPFTAPSRREGSSSASALVPVLMLSEGTGRDAVHWNGKKLTKNRGTVCYGTSHWSCTHCHQSKEGMVWERAGSRSWRWGGSSGAVRAAPFGSRNSDLV